jgi:hypothetical protein
VPVKEETSVFDLHNMLPEWASAALNIPAYLLLIVTFIPNVIIMVPVAQFCGHANTLAGCIGILTMAFLGTCWWQIADSARPWSPRRCCW